MNRNGAGKRIIFHKIHHEKSAIFLPSSDCDLVDCVAHYRKRAMVVIARLFSMNIE